MRRTVAWIVVGLFFAGTSAVSAGDPPVLLSPTPVRQGETLTVTAVNCVSGDGWEAFVAIVFQRGGETKYSSYQRADDDGRTVKNIKMKKKKFRKGNYTVRVDCVHEFDDGSPDGFWYETVHELKVKKPTT